MSDIADLMKNKNMITKIIDTKEEIEALGFEYEPNERECRRYMMNDIPVNCDFRDVVTPLNILEGHLEKMTKGIIVLAMKDERMKKVNKITWDRIFLFPTFNPRQFEAKHWVRIYAKDPDVAADSHCVRG